MHLAKKTFTVAKKVTSKQQIDNAKVHQSKLFKQMKEVWAKKQLFIFYLPTYSLQLNIVERVWKELKERWISVDDYISTDLLFYKQN